MNTGDKLKNGSLLITWKKERDSVVVLALSPKNECVTWLLDENGGTYSGHYYQDLLQAVDDYKSRT